MILCLPCVSGIHVGSLAIKILLFLGCFGVSGTDVFGLCTSAVTLIVVLTPTKTIESSESVLVSDMLANCLV